MRQKRLIVIVCFVVSALTFARLARADQASPAIKYSCNGNDNIVIGFSWELYGSVRYSDKEGIYDPYELLVYKGERETARIVSTKKIIKICNLKLDTYKVIIEPYVFNPNPGGRCGALISIGVTIYKNGKIMLNKTNFEKDCHDEAPIVKYIIVHADKAQVEVIRVDKRL